MRVLLATYGSRGDVEPMAALAARLLSLGVDAKVCAPPDEEFVDLLARAGAPLAPAFSPIRRWIAEKPKPSGPRDLPRLATEMIPAQFEAIAAAAEGCDALVATGLFPSMAAARSAAERFGLVYVSVALCPRYLPSGRHPPYPYPGQPRPPESADNRALWTLNEKAVGELFGGAFNAHRASIGLPPVDDVRNHVLGDRRLLACDPILGPRPVDVDAVQTGAWILPDDRPLPNGLTAFLEAGAPPVYVGFGSIGTQSAINAARTAIETIRARGLRAVASRGWAELGSFDDRDDCFVVGEVNQQALFGRVAAVLHHGGAGTTTAAARAGAPQVIVPQIVDQPYWAGRVAELGVGAAHDGLAPTRESLSAALATALAPATRARAIAVAGSLVANGATIAAKLLIEAVEEVRRNAGQAVSTSPSGCKSRTMARARSSRTWV